MDRVEDESSPWREDRDTLRYLRAHLLRCAEGEGVLRIHAATPEDDAIAEARFQLAGVHAFGGALHRIEDVEAGFDEVWEQLYY